MTLLKVTAMFAIDLNQLVPKIIIMDVSLNFTRFLTVTTGITHNIVFFQFIYIYMTSDSLYDVGVA